MRLSGSTPFLPLVLPAPVTKSPQAPLRELTLALQRGNDVAWQEFHGNYGPRLFRQLLAATRGDHDLASDALQQTYLRVARSIQPCDSEPMFVSWLRVVARSVLHDCWRRRRSFWQMLHRRHADPSDPALFESEDGGDRMMACLDNALGQLDPDDRALLEAKYFSGTDVRTLAEKLMISSKAAESRLTRARAELRRLMISALSRHE